MDLKLPLLTKAKATEQPHTCTNCNGVGKRSRVVVGRYGHAVEQQVSCMCGGAGIVQTNAKAAEQLRLR